MMGIRVNIIIILIVLVWLFSGCGAPRAGVTAGGVQDNSYGRTMVNRGNVPQSKVFTYEGAFSEHDFEIDLPGCKELICLHPFLSIVKREGMLPRYFMQVVMESGVDLSKYRHPPIDLMVVFDISGSMSGQPLKDAKEALKRVVDQLTEQDQLGIILFDDRYRIFREVKGMGTQKDIAALKKKIDTIQTDGGTDIETALRAGYKLIQKGPNQFKRVLLITDARPNINATGGNTFTQIIKDYEKTTGITVFGLGIDFGVDLAKAISETSGGNYIYLKSGRELVERIQNEFELLMVPLTNNFKVALSGETQFKIINSYGLPAVKGKQITLSAKSLFLSNSKGAMAIELEFAPEQKGDGTKGELPKNDQPMMALFWEYDGKEGVIAKEINIPFMMPKTHTGAYYYNIPGTEKIAILIEIISTLKRAADQYHKGGSKEAVMILNRAITEMEALNMTLNDSGIAREIEVMKQLRSNMQRNM